jgi:hypothetical protein
MPFTIYLASAYMGEADGLGGVHRQGTPRSGPDVGPARGDGRLRTVHDRQPHAYPRATRAADGGRARQCSPSIEERLGVRRGTSPIRGASRFAALEPDLAARFRARQPGCSAANGPETDRHRLRRIPVRQSDPLPFFEAKLTGRLRAERAYSAMVTVAKAPAGSLGGTSRLTGLLRRARCPEAQPPVGVVRWGRRKRSRRESGTLPGQRDQ